MYLDRLRQRFFCIDMSIHDDTVLVKRLNSNQQKKGVTEKRCQERMALLLGVIGVMAIHCFFLNEVSGE